MNYALDLAQEWGEEWLKPTQERLRKSYPNMPQTELDRLNSVAQAAMKYGHDLVYSMAEKEGKDINQSVWRETFSSRYPWVDEIISAICSQQVSTTLGKMVLVNPMPNPSVNRTPQQRS